MVDFKKIENKWQKAWEKGKVFEANPNPKKKKYFITVPYPYTSGPLHVGHGRTYTLGDVTARFFRMNNFNVLWPIAWHITGTPILAISKRIENKEKEVIDEHVEYVKLHNPKDSKKIVETFVNPENVANYYSSVISKDLKELGCSIDWRRQFTTGERIYNKFIDWQYHHLNSLGYLIKGSHPVFFCPNDGNPVTADDVKGGDTLEMSISEFYLLKKPFEDGYLVSATLRIETIFGITNIWVNPNVNYVKAKVNGEYWYISEDAANKLKEQNFKVEIKQTFKGKELVGKWALIPLTNRKVIILPAEYVEPDVGSGVVISVPSHAPYDLVALEEIKKDEKLLKEFHLDKKVIDEIKPINLIRVEGYSDNITCDIIQKFGIKSTKEIDKLEKATQDVYGLEFYNGITTEVCEDFANLKIGEAKGKVFEKLYSIKLATKMFEQSVKDSKGNLVKHVVCRCGTGIIIKTIENQWFLDYSNEKWKSDARKLLSKMEIVPELYRKFFENSISWLHEWPCTRNRGLGTRLPYDEKLLIESLSDSTIYMAFYTIVHHIRKNRIKPEQLNKDFFDYVFLGKGNSDQIAKETKIHAALIKQLREEFIHWYPVDERRTAIMHIANHLSFFIFHHAAIFPENFWPKRVSLNEALIAEGKKMSKSLGNVIPLVSAIRNYSTDVVRFFLISATEPSSTSDWREKDVETVEKKLQKFYKTFDIISRIKSKKNLYQVDKWFISEFYKNLKEATELIKNYQFKQYIQKIFFEIMSDIEYLSVRTGKKPKITIDILSDWLLALSPTIPHICEELWHKLGNKSFISLEKWSEFDENNIDRNVLELENMFRKNLEDLTQVIKLTGKKNKACLYFVTDKELEYFEESLNYVKKQFGFKEILLFKTTDKKRYDPENKASKAKYGKPGIYLE